MCVIHGAASCGNIEVMIDLIEKHGVNPRCKGNVSVVSILFVIITMDHVTCNVASMYYVSEPVCNRFMIRMCIQVHT